MYRTRCAVLAIAAGVTTAVAAAAPALAQPSASQWIRTIHVNASPSPVDASEGGGESITVVVPPVATAAPAETSTPTMPPSPSPPPPPPPSIAPPGVGGDRARWGPIPVTGNRIGLFIASALTLIVFGTVLRTVFRRRRSVDNRP